MHDIDPSDPLVAPIPVYTADLLKGLDRTFVHQFPSPNFDRDQLMFEAGKRWLVDWLLAWQRDSEERVYEEATKNP